MAKQLRELLQEKQEPFILELYLLEKGYLKKKFSPSSTTLSCCHGNSRNSVSFDLKRGKMNIPRCSKILRAVYNQVFSLHQRLKIKSSNPGHGDAGFSEHNKHETVSELDRFSSASSSTVFDSCTVSDVEETSTSQQEHISDKVKKAVTDRKLQWQLIEESRVLEEIASHRVPEFLNNETKNLSIIKGKNGSNRCALSKSKVTEDSILSASLWKILVQRATEKPTIPGVPKIQELVQSNNPLSFLKSKTVLQQTKQLLFDCVREIVETQERQKQKQKQKQQRHHLASEKFGKLIGEKIKWWGKRFRGEPNLVKVLELDFQESAQEWIDYEPRRRKIGYEIGDAIMDELRNEIVMDLI